MSVRLPLVGVRLFRGGGEGEEPLMWAALLELLQKKKNPQKITLQRWAGVSFLPPLSWFL